MKFHLWTIKKWELTPNEQESAPPKMAKYRTYIDFDKLVKTSMNSFL